MKQTKNKLKKNPDRKDFAGLGKKVALGLMAATLLMDGTAMAATNIIDNPQEGPQYGAKEIWSDVYGGSLVVRPDGEVIPTYDIHGEVINYGDAYGGYTIIGNTYGPNWNDPSEWVDFKDHYSNEIIVDGVITGNAYGGYAVLGNANRNDNEIHENGIVNGNSYGGYSQQGDASSNKNVIYDTGTVKGNVYGGYSQQGDAVVNTVEVYGYTYHDLYGGYADNGNVRENTVNWGGQQSSDGNIYGGYSEGYEHSANKNEVTIEKNTFAGNVYGGTHVGNKGEVRENYVTINGAGSVNGNVYGGVDRNNAINNVSGGNVHHNIVDIQAGQDETVNVTGNVFGGAAFGNGYGYVEENEVHVSGKVEGNVTGGWIEKDGTAKLNTVDVSGTVTGNVTGGWIEKDGTAKLNTVDVSGTVTGNVTGGVVGHDGNSEGNTVNVSAEGSVKGQIIGGAVNNTGVVHGNIVNIDGIAGGTVIGGYVANNGNAISNTVNVSNKVEDGDVVGGLVHGSGLANLNVVNVLEDGNIVNSAYGAKVDKTGVADNNIVSVSGGTIANAIGAASVETTDGKGNITVGTGDVVNNHVIVTGGEVTGEAVGGISSSDKDINTQLSYNGVAINDGKVNVAVGARSKGAVEARENAVSVNNGNVTAAFGAISEASGQVIDNQVIINNGTVTNAVGSEALKTGDVIDNHIIINDGEVTGQAIGGVSHSDDVNTLLYSNDVTVNNGIVKEAIGAKTTGVASADNNYVQIKGGNVENAIGATATSTGKLTNNVVNIIQGDINDPANPAPNIKVGNATGAESATSSEISNNHVNVSEGATVTGELVDCTITGQLVGGKYTGAGDAVVSENQVTINAGNFPNVDAGFSSHIEAGTTGTAVGAISSGSGDVKDNKVIVGNNVTISGVAGAISEKGALLNNKSTIMSGTVNTAYGAIANGATSVKNNHVKIEGGNVTGGAIGALGTKDDSSSFTDNYVVISPNMNAGAPLAVVNEAAGVVTNSHGDISSNFVLIEDGNVGSATGAISLYEDDENTGVHRDVRVHDNSVYVKNGTVHEAYGAIINGTANADNNQVNITGGDVSIADGALINGTGGAKENEVNITGGNVTYATGAAGGSSAGELAYNSVTVDGINANVTGEAVGAVSVSNAAVYKNLVNIEDGTVNSAAGAISYSNESNAILEENTVAITGGNTTIAQGAVIHGAATAENNAVVIQSGTVTTAIGAKGDGTGKLLNNAVNIIGNEDDKAVSVTEVYGAESTGTGDVKGNTVNVNTDIALDRAVGAYVAGEALVESNEVNVNAGTVEYAAGANVTDKATANKNEVNVNAGNVKTAIGANVIGDSTANGNKVNIINGTVDDATGALGGGTLINNEVNIGNSDPAVDSNPTVHSANGASSLTSKKISGNKVKVNSGVVGDNNNAGSLTGAAYLGSSSTEVSGNSVNIKGGEIASNTLVTGAMSTGTGLVSGNSVTVENPNAVIDNVVGASVRGKADATGNEVVISSGKVNMAAGAIGMSDEKSSFSKNAVQVNGGTVGDVVGTMTKAGDISESKVTVSGGEVTGGIIGGVSSEAGNVSASEVTVSGGTVATSIIGGVSEAGNVSASKITVSGGTINGSIFGGMSTIGDVTDSTIFLSGGTVNGSVFGGISDKGAVRNNVITIKDNADLDGAKLYGYGGKAEGGHSGNTLNIEGRIVYNTFDDIKNGNWNWSTWNNRDLQVLNTISNFDNINIDEAVWGTPAITVENLVLNNTNVHVNHVFAPSVFKQSTVYSGKGAVLIKADNVIGDLNPNSKIDRVDFGVAFTAKDVPINLNHISSEAEYTIDPIQMAINEQTSVIGESRAAATALVNQGSDFMVAALRSMSKAESLEGGVAGAKAFIGGFGNSSKYTTGSHVKVNGWSGIAGVGSTTESGFTWGVFVETGRGSYSTRNNAYDGVELHGDGNADYTGGGVGIRQDYDDGLYFDAGFRAGKMNNKLDDALWGPHGFYGYDVSSNYYGAHIGVGKVFQNGKNSTMEVYGRYAYTHNKGKDFTIAGDEFSFNAMDSHRTQLGVMWEDQVNSQFKVRYGLGYEYEFGGKAGSSVMGYDLTAPSLRGGSLLYQVGMNYQMSDNTSIDLGLTGYSGKRQGISGNLMFNISF